MKHDAIVEQGIPIHERVPIPDDLIPEDSRVEIDAKIHAGYCRKISSYPDKSQTLCITNRLTGLAVTTGKVMNMAELSEVRGRAWDDVDVSSFSLEPYTLLDIKKVLLTCTLVYQALRSRVESTCCTMSCSGSLPGPSESRLSNATIRDVKTPDGRELPQKLKGS